MNFGSYTNLTSLFTAIGNKLRKKVSFELVTQEEYNALVQAGTVDPNVDYHIYDSSVTAAPIDDTATALDKVWSSNKISKSISNPNLIDNPWFTVNQRGQASYSRDTTVRAYTVDRWVIASEQGETTQVDITSEGVVLQLVPNIDEQENGGRSAIYQYIDLTNFSKINGQKVTLSAIIDNTLYSISFILDTTNTSCNNRIPIGNTGIELQYRNWGNGQAVVRIIAMANDTIPQITVKAIKLELGSVSTLAMDTVPNYGIELAKCKTSTAEISDTYANKGKLLATNDLVSTVLTVSTSSWVADTTSQSGTTLYKKEISLSHVYVPCPEVAIGASGTTLPTKDQQTAYDLVQYATVDSSTNKLYLYASAVPSTQFYIKVTGVD